MAHALENAVLEVDAALRRGELPGQTDRRSGDSGPTIGSHASPKTAIFIGSSDLKKVIGYY